MSKESVAAHAFHVHLRDAGRTHAHRVDGVSPEDAAMAFAERWLGPADERVSIVVRDAHSGEERCFHINLTQGAAAPCG